MDRAAAVRRVGVVVLVANLALAAAKGAVYLQTGSLAVGSEALNSLADSAYSVVVFAGLYLTTRPPDFEHPHGHERIEPFVSLFVAAGVFAAGGFVLWQAVRSLWVGVAATTTGPAALGVLLGSAAAKYWLYRYCIEQGEATNSPALVATAMDNRADILTALAALAGVAGAQLGFPVLDPLAAGVVAVGILWTGVEIVRDNLDYLVGRAPPAELRAEILERALAHPEVRGAHDVIAHYVGPEIDVSIHVEVEGDMTLFEAHDIETAVIQSVQELPEVDDVFVHVDPKELGEWKEDATTDELLAQAGEGREEGATGKGGDVDPAGPR